MKTRMMSTITRIAIEIARSGAIPEFYPYFGCSSTEPLA